MSVRLGTRAFTSRITFGLEPASNDSSLTLKTVFSFGFSCICIQCGPINEFEESRTAAGSSAGAAALWTAAGAAAGIATSWIFSRD